MNRSLLGQLSLGLFVCAQGFGVPSAYVSKFGALEINNQTTSSLMRDNQDPNSVWVLPPSAGKTEFSALVPNANLGFCPGLKDLVKASNDIDARIGKIYQKQEELLPELEAAEKELNEARTRLGQVAEIPEIRAILDLNLRISELQDRREKAIQSLEECTQSCEEIKALVESLSADLKTANADLRKLESENREAVRQYRVAESAVDQAKENLDGVGARYLKLTQLLADLNNTVMELYSSKGKLEGGIAQIDYETGWDNNVKQLQADYSNYHFEKIPTYNVRVFGNIVGASSELSYYESLPMILDYTINGMKFVPWAQVDTELTAMPSIMAGNVRLSTLGGCPIIDSQFFEGTGMTPEKGALGTPLFSISATYQYPASFKYKVTASYNLYKFYERIQKQGSQGGFFSSRSYSEVTENKMDKDAFHIDWTVEDPTSSFDSETRSRITAELKRDLMDRVLHTIAQPGIDPAHTAVLLSPGVPPTTGAIVFANGLQQTCGFNIYCQGASWILRGLNAVFGSSESTAAFRQKWDRTATETWSADIATLRPGAVVFGRK